LLLNSAFDHMEHLEVLAQDIVPHLAAAVKASSGLEDGD
jgi:hypothetical protein